MIAIKKLRISHHDQRLVDIALDIHTTLGLVGQSGSGKSLTLKALLGLLPASMQCTIEVKAPFALTRGQSVGFVPQNPFTALSPLSKIGAQFHASADKATEALVRVGLDSWVLDRFAAELSGGQLQRVVIAMAIIHKPRLLLLDEPTTALDHESKQEILDLLNHLHAQEGTLMLFVGHDMAAVSQVCHQLAVIEAGRIVDRGPTEELMQNPTVLETKRLVESNFAYRTWRS